MLHAVVVIDELFDNLFGLHIASVGNEILDVAHLHLGYDLIVKALDGRHTAVDGHLSAGDGHVVLEARQRYGDGQ